MVGNRDVQYVGAEYIPNKWYLQTNHAVRCPRLRYFHSTVFYSSAVCWSCYVSGSLSQWQVWKSLRWSVSLHEQRHMQPYWWLLPVPPWLDWRWLLTGYESINPSEFPLCHSVSSLLLSSLLLPPLSTLFHFLLILMWLWELYKLLYVHLATLYWCLCTMCGVSHLIFYEHFDIGIL